MKNDRRENNSFDSHKSWREVYFVRSYFLETQSYEVRIEVRRIGGLLRRNIQREGRTVMGLRFSSIDDCIGPSVEGLGRTTLLGERTLLGIYIVEWSG